MGAVGMTGPGARAGEPRRHRGAGLAWARAEQVARTSYGRLIALLAAPGGEIELAEDCLADAFAQALRRWPETGVPDNPEAWLLTVARNRRRDVFRSAAHRRSVPLEVEASASVDPLLDEIDPDAIPDRRLALLFVCAHPAIEVAVRTPLMLQTALGLEARQIARAFAIPEGAMAQRLVRAKRRIRGARLPFVVPDRSRMAGRLVPVLEAVYGAYSIDWLVAGPNPRGSLAAEAHYLATTLADLLGEEPEAHGLAALISLSLSRVAARAGRSGEFVPLEEQDPTVWDAEMIAQGEGFLRRAHALGRPGRFQLEAAIQSVHCARATTGATDWSALRTLYTGLVALAPTLGARVALAATVGRIEGPDAGLAALETIRDPALARFQPAWATRAHLLAEAGRREEARQAYGKAISLTSERPMREYLARRREDISAPSDGEPDGG